MNHLIVDKYWETQILLDDLIITKLICVLGVYMWVRVIKIHSTLPYVSDRKYKEVLYYYYVHYSN